MGAGGNFLKLLLSFDGIPADVTKAEYKDMVNKYIENESYGTKSFDRFCYREILIAYLNPGKSIEELIALKSQIENLRMANSLIGSEENKRETKLKINSLIREIDYCIAQLSD